MSAIAPAAALPAAAIGSPRRVWPAFLLGSAVFGSLAFPLLILVFVGTKFEEVFRDFGVSLPLLTRWLLSLARVLDNPAILLAGLLLIAGASCGAGLLAHRSRAALIVMLCLLFAWLPLAFGVLTVSLFLPLVSMIESLESGGGAV